MCKFEEEINQDFKEIKDGMQTVTNDFVYNCMI